MVVKLGNYGFFANIHEWFPLKVVNRVSQKVVEEHRFDTRSDLGSPTMLGLCSDVGGGAYYAYDEISIFEV